MDELRSATDHLLLIKEHLRSLAQIITQLGAKRYSPAGVAALRHGMLDVRMVVEELMLLSVSAHEEAGREMAKAIRTEYRADKKMSRLRRLNPRFFPDAIDLVPTDQPGLAGRFASVEEPYLTEEDAERYYHETGGVLHASWKYLGGPAFDRHVAKLAEFHDRAARLLRTFELDISGTGTMILGHLNLDADEPPQAFEARTAM